MPKPSKKALAQIKVMSDMGLTPHSIGKQIGHDPKTIRSYLRSEVYSDPEIQKMVDIIKEKELQDLRVLNAKARANLHKRFDGGSPNVIESTAVMDRTFNQVRLLEGHSTANVTCLATLVERVHKWKPEPERLENGKRLKEDKAEDKEG